MADPHRERIAKALDRIVQTKLDNMKRLTRGKLRQAKGELLPHVVHFIWDEVAKARGCSEHELRDGDRDTVKLENPAGAIEHKQDLHGYIRDQLVVSIECKAYTETAMYKRVIFDGMLMRHAKGKNVDVLLVQLEEARAPEAIAFLDKFTETISAGEPVRTFTLMEGHRSSARRIEKPRFRKEVNYAAALALVKYFDSLFERWR